MRWSRWSATASAPDRLAQFHAVTHVRFTTAICELGVALAGSRGTAGPRRSWRHGTGSTTMLVEHAVAAGATVLGNHEATAPIVERGFVRGARLVRDDGTTTELRAAFTVVADGANSRFGRALGTYRQPSWPSALAHRAIYASSLHDAAEIEFVVDLEDRAGTPITGYGWMFPRGDGTANVGVLMMSTSPSFLVVNPAHLLDRFVADNGTRWRLHGDPVHPAGRRPDPDGCVGAAGGGPDLSRRRRRRRRRQPVLRSGHRVRDRDRHARRRRARRSAPHRSGAGAAALPEVDRRALRHVFQSRPARSTACSAGHRWHAASPAQRPPDRRSPVRSCVSAATPCGPGTPARPSSPTDWAWRSAP